VVTSVTAGTGLTGGGSGAVTLNVGAGDGIVVNADDVAIDPNIAGTGLAHAAGVLSVNTATGITTSGDNVIHATGDAGDLHTNYAEHDQTETISGSWTFTPQTIFTAGIVVNEGGGSATTDDFRVESTGSTNMFFVDASTNQVGIFTGAPHASATFQVGGTGGGFRLPKLTTTERNALSPTTGLMIYNTTDGEFQGYDGSWKVL
jgi:hypothetical protein